MSLNTPSFSSVFLVIFCCTLYTDLTMSQRHKILLAFCITILLFTGSVISLSQYFFIRSVAIVEKSELQEAGHRLISLIQDDLEQVDRIVTDWAYWDDAWNYMRGTDGNFEKSNLSISTLQNLRLQGLYFFTADGSIRYGTTADQSRIDALEQLGSISPADIMETGRAGLIRDGNRLYLAAGRAILHSDGYGPPAGSLWMIWSLGERRTARYSKLLGLTIRFLPEGYTTALGQNAESAGVLEQTFNQQGDLASMILQLQDMYGNQIIPVMLQQNRTIYHLGRDILLKFTVAIMLSFVGVSLILYLALRIQFISPLAALTHQLIEGRNNPEQILALRNIRHDEIDGLIRAFNALTEELSAKIREREQLISEIYHRVNNNLQIMASILQLQTYRSRNEETVALSDRAGAESLSWPRYSGCCTNRMTSLIFPLHNV